MKIVDINTLKGSDRHGSCIECEKDFVKRFRLYFRNTFGLFRYYKLLVCGNDENPDFRAFF